MISNKHINEQILWAMEQSDAIFAKATELRRLMTLPVEDLLKILLESPDVPSCVFVRKVLLNDDVQKKLKEEFASNVDTLFRITPFTLLAPGLPITTYQGAWKNHSGILGIVPPGGIPLVSYKRPACSNLLPEDKMQTISFPLDTEKLLRPQGGKPSYSITDAHRARKIKHLRKTGAMSDQNRKTYLRELLMKFHLNHPGPSSLAFSATELRALHKK